MRGYMRCSCGVATSVSQRKHARSKQPVANAAFARTDPASITDDVRHHGRARTLLALVFRPWTSMSSEKVDSLPDRTRTRRKLPNRETAPQTAHSTDGAVGGYMSVALQPVHLRRGFIGHGTTFCSTRRPCLFNPDCSCQEDIATDLACAVTAPHLAHSTAVDLRRRRRRQTVGSPRHRAGKETVSLCPSSIRRCPRTHAGSPTRCVTHPEGNISMAAQALHCPWNSRGGPPPAASMIPSPKSRS